MATYTYICDTCGNTSTIQHGIDYNPDVECPLCPVTSKMRRSISVPAITFKGTGWGSDKRGPTK